MELTPKQAITKLEEKIRKKSFDYQVKDLKENFSLDEVFEVYIPVYEARLIGPKKKVQIMRIDAVRNKII